MLPLREEDAGPAVTLGPGIGGAVHHLHGGDDHLPAVVQDQPHHLPQLAPCTAAAVTSLAVELGCSFMDAFGLLEDRNVVDRQQEF